jgi:hypothetical protein
VSCGLVDIGRLLEAIIASIIRAMSKGFLITLMMEAVSSFEMPVSIYHTVQCNIPEGSFL